MQTIPCPACGRTIGIDSPPGTRVQCPLCAQVVIVPGAGDAMMPPPQATFAGSTSPFPQPMPMQMPYAHSGMVLPNSGLAVASMVCGICGIVGLCMWGLGAIVGLVGIGLGIAALSQIRRRPDRLRGRGMAIAGISTGSVSVLLAAAIIVVVTSTPFLKGFKAVAGRAQCHVNVQAISTALQAYAEADSGQMYPDDIQKLVKSGELMATMLHCDQDPSTGRSYYYVPGYGLKSDPMQVILYEHPDVHKDEDGGFVVYQGGSIIFEKGAKYHRLISNIKLPNGKRFAPHEN